ncbi:MAG: hypothetical protein AB1473_21945 [Thermodesulfobacteriota bacterium]
MKKNQDRKMAERRFLDERGRITNKELAQQLGLHPATIARWKKLDDWERKLMAHLTSSQTPEAEEEDFYTVDLRHLKALNDRIDSYLQRKELLPSEILELAEAKYRLMHCMEIINDRLRYPVVDEYMREED